MKNKPYTFVIIGRSGSGKGTQLKMLADYLKRVDEKTHIQSYVCGDAFRNFFKEDSTLSNQVIESVNQGFYQPDFLATTLLFRDQIFGNINNNDHLFLMGIQGH